MIKDLEPEFYTLGVFLGDSLDYCFGKYYFTKEDAERKAQEYTRLFENSKLLFNKTIVPIGIYLDWDIEDKIKEND